MRGGNSQSFVDIMHSRTGRVGKMVRRHLGALHGKELDGQKLH